MAAHAADFTYIYDHLGRLIAVVDPTGDTVQYSYDAVGNLLAISRQSSSLISLIDFTPKSGPVSTSVTIFGTGFSATPSQNTVSFNGTPGAVSTSTETQIVTAVPAGATTGPITVTTPAGSATSTTPFTVTVSGPPTISGFTPTIGTLGTAVTINGANFEPTPANNRVLFNTNVTFAAVASATGTTLGTNVPSRVGSGRIAVTTPAGQAVSAQDFFIPPSPYTTADVEVTGRMAVGESRTVTIGGPGKIGLIVFDGTAGQALILNITGVTLAGTTVAVNNPNGTALSSRFVGTTGGTLNLALPVTGTYTIVVDPSGTNTGSMTLTLANAPDLVPTALTAPASPVTQQTISVSWTITNQGAGATPSGWTDNLYLSTDAICCTGDTLLLSMANPTALAPGGSYSQTRTVTIPNVPAGNYYLIVVTDAGNILYEVSETNNQRVLPITVMTPDLTPTALTAPASAVTQQAISVSWTVTNQGTGATQPTWVDYLYLSTDTVCCTGDTLVTALTNPAALAAGGSYTQTRTVTVPNVPAGNYYLILRVDHVNGVYEADETNNQRVMPITITTPDLTPTALTAPASAVTQQAISVSWTVTNQGTGTTQPTWLDYLYLSTDTVCCTGDTLVSAFTNPAALAPGGSYTQTKTVTVPNVAAGNYYLILRVDHVNGVYEANETNNQRVVPITISP